VDRKSQIHFLIPKLIYINSISQLFFEFIISHCKNYHFNKLTFFTHNNTGIFTAVGLMDKAKQMGKKVAIVKNIDELNTYSPRDLTIADITLKDSINKGIIISGVIKKRPDEAYYHYIENNPKREHVIQSDNAINVLPAKHPELIVMDRKAYMCEQGNCFSMNNDLQKYYYDYGHHTLIGA
jgi:metal-dependent hydrolase (beta-lactamase superfamily II)